ncbi:hypothetical protein HMPREF1326_01087, partial [Akkermansia sp. KLE1605]
SITIIPPAPPAFQYVGACLALKHQGFFISWNILAAEKQG